MDILNKILTLMKEKQLKQKDLMRHLGISDNNFTEWNGGRSQSYMKYLPQISEFLNVSMDYLAGTNDFVQVDNPQIENPANNGGTADVIFSADELHLIELFRAAPSKKRFEAIRLLMDSRDDHDQTIAENMSETIEAVAALQKNTVQKS